MVATLLVIWGIVATTLVLIIETLAFSKLTRENTRLYSEIDDLHKQLDSPDKADHAATEKALAEAIAYADDVTRKANHLRSTVESLKKVIESDAELESIDTAEYERVKVVLERIACVHLNTCSCKESSCENCQHILFELSTVSPSVLPEEEVIEGNEDEKDNGSAAGCG